LVPLPPSQVGHILPSPGKGNTSEITLLLSERRVERSISEGETVFALLVFKKGEEKTPLHPLVQSLIHEYRDVFPNDLPPGLPLVRDIKHQIGLLPRISLPNKLAYRCNPMKTKKLQR